MAALLPAQQQLLLQQAQAQLLAAAVQQSNAAHAHAAAHAAAAANQAQAQQQHQAAKQEQSTVQAPPQLSLSQPIQLTAQVREANHPAVLGDAVLDKLCLYLDLYLVEGIAVYNACHLSSALLY